MKILAAFRLLADSADDSKALRKEGIQKDIDTAQKQIKQLKQGMPSRENRMSVSTRQQAQIQKQIADKKGRIADLRIEKDGI